VKARQLRRLVRVRLAASCDSGFAPREGAAGLPRETAKLSERRPHGRRSHEAAKRPSLRKEPTAIDSHERPQVASLPREATDHRVMIGPEFVVDAPRRERPAIGAAEEQVIEPSHPVRRARIFVNETT
jgi:hypothetical protein